ncbi:RDD family protein [Polymorphospora sp. 2-325]|uniref:RDD family protein n=1 Tax=Polymorphospora lycopeni TaxID=3140240 RepID=A0ABV5CXX3_9ACTN
MSLRPPSPAQPRTAEAGLVSGEAVEVDVRVARVGSRVVALLIDVVMQAQIALALALVGMIGLAAVANRFTVDKAFERGLFTVGVIVVLVLYPTLFETFAGGRTIGKAALGLRVVREDGGPVRFRHALTRSLVGVAVEWPGLVLPLVTWLASLGAMLSNPRARRLGDLAAGTLVVHDRTPAAWGWIPGMPAPLAGWARRLDLTGLPDDLALTIRHYLARGHRLVEPARSRLGQQLANEVAATTAPPPPPGVPAWAYLAAVLAERHRRAALRLSRARAARAALWPDLAASPLIGRPVPVARLEPKAESWTPDVVRPPAPVQPGPDWPSQRWPTPPWLGPTAELPDWTGMRPPPVASTLRPSTPPDEAAPPG